MQDRYADAQALPPVDASQDWTLVDGEEEDGYTILRFTRPWVTCDDRDRDIEVSLGCLLPMKTNALIIAILHT